MSNHPSASELLDSVMVRVNGLEQQGHDVTCDVTWHTTSREGLLEVRRITKTLTEPEG